MISRCLATRYLVNSCTAPRTIETEVQPRPSCNPHKINCDHTGAQWVAIFRKSGEKAWRVSICRCSGVRRGAELHLSRPHPGAQAALVAARRPGAAPAYCSRRVSACGLDKLACTRLPNSGAAEPQQETTDNPTADSSRELRADGRHSTPEQLSPRSRRHRPPRANTEPARTALPARIIPRHRRRRAVCALARSSGARVCCAFQGIRFAATSLF